MARQLPRPHRRKYAIEIKSLNSKQLDLNTKLPWLYKEKEPEIRNLISQRLDRGKIDFSIYCDMLDDEVATVINKNAVRNYYNQFKDIAADLKIDLDDQIFTAIMKLPDTMKTEKPELSESEWAIVKQQIIESVTMLDMYRIEEGLSIMTDLNKCIGKILSFLETVGTFEAGQNNKNKGEADVASRRVIWDLKTLIRTGSNRKSYSILKSMISMRKK